MSGRVGYRSVNGREPCPVCGSDSWCRWTTDSFRLRINRGGVMTEVAAPGTVLCMRPQGAAPGFDLHGSVGAGGGQHYVPHSIYASVKGGSVTGEQISAEAWAKRERERKLAEFEERMEERKRAGKVWAMARTRGELRLKAIMVAQDGIEPNEMSAADRSTLMYLEAVAYLNTRLGFDRPVHENVRLVRAPQRTIGDIGLPYCIRSIDKLGLYETEEKTKQLHRIGDHPALLGAMIAPDGKVAAVQRIYLEKDSRKSVAKKIVGDPCPGAAVYIGTPEQFGQVRDADGKVRGTGGPECVIVCEGIETGFALWMACGAERGIPVLALISTAGVQNICFPPEWTDSQLGKLKRVIFAPDHDRYNSKTSKRPGITAARLGAAKLREKHAELLIDIALPAAACAPTLIGAAPGKSDEFGDVLGGTDGAEGKSVDWLDVYLTMGPDVVWKHVTGGVVGVGERKDGADGGEESFGGGREVDDREAQIGVVGATHSGNREGLSAGGFGRVYAASGGCDPAGISGSALTDSGWGGGDPGCADREDGDGCGGEGAEGFAGRTGGVRQRENDENLGGGSRGGGTTAEAEKQSGRGGGGGGGSGTKEDPFDWQSIPPILPRGHLAQSRECIKAIAGLSASAAGRAKERWTLAYVPATQGWLEYKGTHYEPISREVLAGRVLDFFEPYHQIKKKADYGDKYFETKDGRLIVTHRAGMTYGNAESVVSAMVGDAVVHPKNDTLPAWSPATFDGAGNPNWGGGLWQDRGGAGGAGGVDGAGGVGGRVIAAKNGLLRLDALMENRVVIEKHTPRYVSLTCAPYDLPAELIQRQIDEDPEDEMAGGELCRKLCPEWLKFLKGASDDCEIWQRELGKFFGLSLTDIVMDRAAFLIGQPRTGKGTIAETLIEVLGESNVVTSRLASIVGRHELHNFVGKSMLLFDELEVGHQTDTAEAVGRLKTIIAGTPVSADPKHKDAFTFRVLGKVMITANKIPRLRDASGALADRLIVFPMGGESHRGREDYGLKARLRSEARGILVWSLFHLRLLLKQGRLHQPPEGEKALENFRRLSSPIYAFLKDCMVVHAPVGGEDGNLGGGVEEALLRRLYEAWANDAGVGRMGQENFLADLMATVKNVRRETVERVGEVTKKRVLLGLRPRLFGEDEMKAMAWRGEKPFIVWMDELDRLDHYGFQFPAEEERGRGKTRTEQYPDAGSMGGQGSLVPPV